MESPGFFFIKIQGPGKSFGPGKYWKLKFKVVESRGKYP